MQPAGTAIRIAPDAASPALHSWSQRQSHVVTDIVSALSRPLSLLVLCKVLCRPYQGSRCEQGVKCALW